ncbi:alpha/beta hydrolase [Nocardiopsis alkaliphila]|uniref:alpha/beta hydrolase n=1 Tax=Nocardiopsis alkaliphila TaxID=225762 RepID=UPI00034BB283|nr:alpha/beta hydrolase [Nocardiopsis alkaliphila]
MRTETASGLGLPGDIDADPDTIRSGAEALVELRLSLTGQTEETDSRFRSSAGEFTDLVAWDITTAAADELILWEDTLRDLTYGAAALEQWAQDIEDYRAKRTNLEDRFNTAITESAEALGDPFAVAKPLSRIRELLLEEHRGYWNTLMEQAEEASDSLRNGPSADALARMAQTGLLTGTQLSYFGDSYPGMLPDDLPSPDDHPSTVNTWWHALDEEEQQQLMEDHPELLRDLDGIPATVRDQLNREHLEEEIDRLEEEITEHEERTKETAARGGNGSDSIALSMANDDTLDQELQTLLDLRESLEEEDSDRYLLALDTNGRGRAIVSNGNPDTADNVATLVPGTTTTWQSIDAQMDRAEALHQSATAAGEGSDHAVISWIGYDAPNFAEAAGTGRAEGAVDELSRFQDGLRATHENTTRSNNTVIGHSYGSTVVGHTAQSEAGLNADEVVLVGSPGTNAQHASELGFLPENVHASTAKNDGITGLTDLTHGADPTSPEFGATVFESDEGSEGGQWPLGAAHSEYFKNGSLSLKYMGEVIAGKH